MRYTVCIMNSTCTCTVHCTDCTIVSACLSAWQIIGRIGVEGAAGLLQNWDSGSHCLTGPVLIAFRGCQLVAEAAASTRSAFESLKTHCFSGAHRSQQRRPARARRWLYGAGSGLAGSACLPQYLKQQGSRVTTKLHHSAGCKMDHGK